jgi:hypothetical protein
MPYDPKGATGEKIDGIWTVNRIYYILMQLVITVHKSP